MACSVALPWNDALLDYDFGASHPMNPVRVELTLALAAQLGIRGQLHEAVANKADDDLIRLAHTPRYIDAVREAGTTLRPNPSHGLGTPDDPVFPDMHDASALVVGATVQATQAVLDGATEHGVNISGGLHHAMADRASGFCVYDDPVIAIRMLLDAGVDKVAYVDIDVHHGDGVQAAFWDEPRVLTISLHQTGRTLFPGTGFATEVGGPRARGRAVNVALPPGTDDTGWHYAFDHVVPSLLRAFDPSYLVTQHGCDTHALDPLAHLMLSVDGQRLAAQKLHALAHEITDGKWTAVGGGGYETVQVVPRTWTHLLAEAAGSPLDPATATPQEWRQFVKQRTGRTAPLTMTDDRPATSDVDTSVAAAVEDTRRNVFAAHGLDA